MLSISQAVSWGIALVTIFWSFHRTRVVLPRLQLQVNKKLPPPIQLSSSPLPVWVAGPPSPAGQSSVHSSGQLDEQEPWHRCRPAARDSQCAALVR